MSKVTLIGDSGGTGTDWCLVNAYGEKEYFSTESYHPVHFSPEFFHRMELFWKKKNLDVATTVYFFGTACSLPHNKELVQQHFQSLGLTNITVDSDLKGACLASCGNTPGVVGIMGTGSVLATYDGNEVVDFFGGFGYLIGDEGSGYAFGRLLLHRYLNRDLSEKLMTEIDILLGGKKEIMRSIYAADGKRWISGLAMRLVPTDEVVAIHNENINLFLDFYLEKIKDSTKKISIVGTYGFKNKILIENSLIERGWTLSRCIEKPIELIVKSILGD